jgi:hypothetical protein
MSTSVTIQTTDGRIIHGINYTVDSARLPTNVTALAAGMQGGMNMGVYHIRTANGWQYIPASQIQAVLRVKPGVPT